MRPVRSVEKGGRGEKGKGEMEREVEKGKEKRNLAAQGGKVQSRSVGGGVELSPCLPPSPWERPPTWPGTATWTRLSWDSPRSTCQRFLHAGMEGVDLLRSARSS